MLNAGELLTWRRVLLKGGGEASDLDWLLEMAGGVGWQQLQQLHLHPQRQVQIQLSRSGMEALWRQHRQTHTPLQYLVGCCPWRDLELQVGPGVLIPRQETELLIDLAIGLSQSAMLPKKLLWADLGTGSGCLALALGRLFPDGRGLALDVSAEARARARGNLYQHGLSSKVAVLAGDWWKGLSPWWGHLDLVVANPPYIPSSLLARLDAEVRDHEPVQALDGGPDGLDCIRVIAAMARRSLAVGGVIVLEHHHDQSAIVLELLLRSGLSEVKAHRDLEGVNRFASARLTEPSDHVPPTYGF